VNVTQIEAALRELGTAERAAWDKSYLKSELTHFGVKLPDQRQLLRELEKEHGKQYSHDALIELVSALWARPIHELRTMAALLVCAYPKLIGPSDVPLLEKMLRESKTWALVDELSTHAVGALFERHDIGAVLDRWSKDEDFWIRRASMLALLRPLKKGGDFDRFARYADAMLEEKEFFIRKAIGWILREVGKERPALVADWLAPRAARASGVTIREAVKYLPDRDRERILSASRPNVRR
jgi:3-methyladenine DNA glycosylase AlkD